MAMEEVLIVNPTRRRKTTRRKTTSRRRTTARRRPARRATPRRRTTARRKSASKSMSLVMRHNPARRRRRAASGSRNPIKAWLKNPGPVLFTGLGAVGGMIAARKVSPFLATYVTNPMYRALASSGIVLAGGLLLGAKGKGKAKDLAAGLAAGAIAEVMISVVLPKVAPSLSNTLAGLDEAGLGYDGLGYDGMGAIDGPTPTFRVDDPNAQALAGLDGQQDVVLADAFPAI